MMRNPVVGPAFVRDPPGQQRAVPDQDVATGRHVQPASFVLIGEARRPESLRALAAAWKADGDAETKAARSAT